MKKKKAVCLISGGLDSCVTAFLAKKQGYDISALSFRYGQRHRKELTCAKKIAQAVQAHEHIIFDIDLETFGGSSLLSSSSLPIKNQKHIGRTIPATYVPARNTIFLSLALAFAETRNADAIFIGVNEVDYSGYPDCRPEYIEAFQRLADLATKKAVEGKKITIQAPLLHLRKSEIIKKGIQLRAPLADTWSCYRGGKKACGTCDSCRLRLQGFSEAKRKDPLSYEKKKT